MFAHYCDAPPIDGDLGESVRRLRNFGGKIGRLLFVTVDAEPDDLGRRLLDIVRLLRQKKIGINWHLLFGDIAAWSSGNTEVPKRWVRNYWGIENSTVETGPDNIGRGANR